MTNCGTFPFLRHASARVLKIGIDPAVNNTLGQPTSVQVTFPVPTYAISLDKTGTYTFTAATAGYSAQTHLTVNITNSGNQATGALAVVKSGTNATNYTVSTASINSLAVAGSSSFTVVPNTGLAAGIS